MVLLLLASLASAAIIPDLSSIFSPKQFELLESNTKPIINTDELQKRITSDALENLAIQLWEAANTSTHSLGHPTRAIGTPGHNATLQLIFDSLDELSDYYTYEVQPFVALGSRIHNWSVTSQYGNTVNSRPLSMSPPVNVSSARIHFVPNKGCLPSDFVDAKDKIAVIPRGGCPFGDKSELAGLSGAKAVLLWDPNAPDTSQVFTGGDLGTPLGHQVATLGISGESALRFEENDHYSVIVDSEIIQIDTVNIIAETKGGDHDNVVFAGSHTDSVLSGPGINDNGSGLLTLLEVAKQLSNFEVKNAVRFAWWSAEEIGLKGSLYYTDNLPKSEAAKIRLFMDYDMLASPNYAYEIYDSDDKENPKGSSALRDMYKKWYKDHGYNYTMQPFDGRSDYVGFIEIGVPASGVDAGVEELKTREDVEMFGGVEGIPFDPCYHERCDNLDNVNYEPWLVNAKLVAHSIAGYATSLEGFPEKSNSFYEQRDPTPRKWSYNNLS